jgi:hypothetical protein
LYLYPEEALNFKYERLLGLDSRGILWTDVKGMNENAN